MAVRVSKPLETRNHKKSQHLRSFSLCPMLCHATCSFFLHLEDRHSHYPHYLGEKTEVQRCENVCIRSGSWELRTLEPSFRSASWLPNKAADCPQPPERAVT